MLEDLKSFYAKMFSYNGEATAREVYNPLVISLAVGIFFAIGNSFAQGYVTKWLVAVVTVVWGVATLLSLWAIGVRRVTWMRRSVAVLVIAALCAVCGVGLWLCGFGVPTLLGGVLRPIYGYCGVGVLALGVVVWLAWVLPSNSVSSANRGKKASRKPSRAKTSRHGASKEINKGKHLSNHTPRSISSDGVATKSAGGSVNFGKGSAEGSAPARSGAQQGINSGVLTL